MQQDSLGFSIKVFIGHSAHDVKLVQCVINLLIKALHLRSDQIRCTSVDGHRLPAGTQIDERLRVEVHDAELFIGIISPNSIRSVYVIFEIGARWGAQKPMIPLLAAGATPEHLEGPLAGINALNSGEEGQVHQLVENAASYLGLKPDNPSSYLATIKELVRLSKKAVAIDPMQGSIPAAPQLSEDVKELLSEAAADKMGMILVDRMMSGVAIRTNGKGFGEMGNKRSEAKWEQAINDLIDHGFVEDREGIGEVFNVTHRGFQVADGILQSNREA